MFSGLIESVGRVAEVSSRPSGRALRVASGLAGELSVGDSIAVNGVCLTVVRTDGRSFDADVSPETARVTALGAAAAGTLVNLERPVRADGRLGGHFVLGHVDAVGRIEAIRAEADCQRVCVGYPPHLQALIVDRGSIALDGISLTVIGPDRGRFEVQIVPHTWRETNLHAAAAGDAVNLECDIIGKYVLRALEAVRGGALPAAGPSPSSGDQG